MKLKTFFAACLIIAAGITRSSADNVSVADVKALTKAGVSDEVILSHIRNAHAVFRLSTAEIIELKDTGVSQKVIDFMINTPSAVAPAPGREVVADTAAPVPAPPPPAVQEVALGTSAPALLVETIPPQPDPYFVWVAGGWAWRRTRLGYGYWEWMPGRWARPPYRGAVWIGGGWGWEHRGWGGGYWR